MEKLRLERRIAVIDIERDGHRRVLQRERRVIQESGYVDTAERALKKFQYLISHAKFISSGDAA